MKSIVAYSYDTDSTIKVLSDTNIGATSLNTERAAGRVFTLIDSSIWVLIVSKQLQRDPSTATLFPISMVGLNFVKSNLLKILILFAFDLAAYLDCNFSMQLYLEFNSVLLSSCYLLDPG